MKKAIRMAAATAMLAAGITGGYGAMTAQAAPATNTQTSVTAGGGCAPAPFGLWRPWRPGRRAT